MKQEFFEVFSYLFNFYKIGLHTVITAKGCICSMKKTFILIATVFLLLLVIHFAIIEHLCAWLCYGFRIFDNRTT